MSDIKKQMFKGGIIVHDNVVPCMHIVILLQFDADDTGAFFFSWWDILQ